MATYRYYDVRRKIYELCSSNPLKTHRTFADMKKLFKVRYWLILIGVIICLLICTILLIFSQNKFFGIIPILVIVVLTIISDLLGERLYNHSERKNELEDTKANLDNYLGKIKNILNKHGIVTKEQRIILKSECENQLSLHNMNFKSVNSNVFNMFIGVPLGALISAFIYKSESTNIIIGQLIAIIALGLTIIGVTSIIKKITYYSDGYFKDQCLLNALKELDYLSE